jgi:hypothetical protein
MRKASGIESSCWILKLIAGDACAADWQIANRSTKLIRKIGPTIGDGKMLFAAARTHFASKLASKPALDFSHSYPEFCHPICGNEPNRSRFVPNS